jgi:hypothetical protein
MRLFSVLCAVVLLCAFATGQATVIGGRAGNWAPAYGVYAAPYVPLITTPSVTLSTVSPSAVGASNATWGNVAGATNATLSEEFVADPPVGVYTQPVWYGPSAPFEGPSLGDYSRPMREERKHATREQGFDFIAASREGTASVVTLRASAGAGRKAARTYTNQDADRMNQTNGSVKWDGKSEHI